MDFLEGLANLTAGKPVREWTNEELFASCKSLGMTPCPAFVRLVDQSNLPPPMTCNLLAVTTEIQRRLKLHTSVGPDAFLRSVREVVITPGQLTLDNEKVERMHLGMAVGTRLEATVLAGATILLTSSRAELVDSVPKVVVTSRAIYPQVAVIREGTGNEFMDKLVKDMKDNATNVGMQQVRIAESILRVSKEKAVHPVQVLNGLLQQWPSTGFHDIMAKPDPALGLPKALKVVLSFKGPPAPPMKARDQINLVRLLQLHAEVRGQNKSKLVPLLQGSYLGDIGASTSMVTTAMSLESVLSYLSKALFPGVTPFYRLDGYNEDVKDQLSKTMAIFKDTGKPYDKDCVSGRRSGTSYVVVYGSDVSVPTVTKKGSLSHDVVKVVQTVKSLREHRYIVESFGYQELFSAFPDSIMLNPVGHKGTVFVCPINSSKVTYQDYAIHTEYCAAWRTLFPYHRLPMWTKYDAGYSFFPLTFNSKRRMDAVLLDLDLKYLDDDDDRGNALVDDFVYDRLVPQDAPLPEPRLDDLLFGQQDEIKVKEEERGPVVEIQGDGWDQWINTIAPEEAPNILKKKAVGEADGKPAPAIPEVAQTPPAKEEPNGQKKKGGRGGGGGRGQGTKQGAYQPVPQNNADKKTPK